MTAPKTFQLRAVVDHVHDGDTIVVELDQGLGIYQRPISLRFYGVDAPELDTPEGKKSLAALEKLVKPGDKLTLVSYGWDKYSGRIDATVFTEDEESVITLGLEAGWLRLWNGRGPRPW